MGYAHPPDLLRAFPECVGTPANDQNRGLSRLQLVVSRNLLVWVQGGNVYSTHHQRPERNENSSPLPHALLEEAKVWTTISLEPGEFFLGLEKPSLRSSPSIINGVQSYLSNTHGWSSRVRGSVFVTIFQAQGYPPCRNLQAPSS